MVKREELEQILLELLKKKRISVDKIVVFGSYVKDKIRPDSDMDIIIVSKDFRNKDIFERVVLTRGIHREMVQRFRIPFDIMYYSDEEWERGYSLIINTAKETGEIIYG